MTAKALIAHQTGAVVVALHVHDGIDAHRVSVAFDAGPHHGEFASDPLFDIGIGGFHIHHGGFHHLHFYGVRIDSRAGDGIGDKMSKTFIEVSHTGDLDIIETDLPEQQTGGFLAMSIGRDGQAEGKLQLAVSGCVAIGTDQLLFHNPSPSSSAPGKDCSNHPSEHTVQTFAPFSGRLISQIRLAMASSSPRKPLQKEGGSGQQSGWHVGDKRSGASMRLEERSLTARKR